MNFTEKIAEQCNGSPQCELSSQPTYIHKCGKISDYLYVSYKCVRASHTHDICESLTRTLTLPVNAQHSKSLYIKSSDFPSEYAGSLDCSCAIRPTVPNSLKVDILWFALQDNDYLSLLGKNLSGWLEPSSEWTLPGADTHTLRFVTDDSLAYKGFWVRVAPRKHCQKDWHLVGESCVKVMAGEALDWRSANKRCQQMSGHLLRIEDVVADVKVSRFMSAHYPEVDAYWIGLRKYLDEFSREKWMWSSEAAQSSYSDVSWWPWKETAGASTVNNCVVKRKNEDGYFTTSCDPVNKHSFICQTQAICKLKNVQCMLVCHLLGL